MRYIQENDEIVTQHTVCYLKNGPHDKWSWLVYVDEPRAVGIGVSYLMKEKLIPENNENLYLLFHCRTHDIDITNEYYDHVLRLAWIGRVDPQPLDVRFFRQIGDQDI